MSNTLDRRRVRGSMLEVDNLYGTAFVGEEDAHTFRITDYEGSEAVAFAGEIAGKFINPTGVSVPLSGSLDGDGRALVTLDEHCYAVEGRFILTIWAGREVIYCGVGHVMNSQTETVDYPTAAIPDVAALIQQLQTILNNWPADYSQLQSDVSNLKSALLYANDGLITFRPFGNFQHYGLNPDGSFLTTQKYRVSNNDPITFDRDIEVHIKSGFKWGYIPFSDGTAGTWHGWITTTTVIPANMSFVVQIARATENTSETADVLEFTNAVTFSTVINNKIDALETAVDLTKAFSSDDFTRGAWSNSGTIDTVYTRICNRDLIPITKGSKVIFTVESGFNIGFGIFSKGNSPSVIYYSGWLTTSGEYELESDGNFFVQARYSDDSTINTTAAFGTVVLNCGIKYSTDKLFSDVSSIQNDIDTIDDEIDVLQNNTVNENNSIRLMSTKNKTLLNRSFSNFNHYGFNADGTFNTSQQYRVSCTTPMVFDYDVVIDVANGFRWGYLKFVNGVSTGVYYGWYTTEQKIKAGTSFAMQVARVTENTSEIADVDEFLTAISINTKAHDLSGAVKYFGESIPSRVHSFDYSTLFNMSYDGTGTSQDIETFENWFFVAISTLNVIQVYSLENYSLVASMSVNVNHGSQMQFSNEYYQDGDDFPLLYVGGWSDNIINVVRITVSGNTWSATIIKKLYIPTSYGYYFAPTIDKINNIMYCFGNKINSTSSTGNANVILKCDLSQLTNNGDDTYTPRIVESHELAWLGTFQGGKYYNGRLYIGFANTNSPYNSRLVVINTATGDVSADIDMTDVTTGENEGVCYMIVGNEMRWLYSDYFSVYELVFY